MIFSVFANLNNNDTENIARDMLSVLNETDCTVYFENKYKEMISDVCSNFSDSSSLMNLCDIAVVIGGDGTTMKIAKKAAILGKPALGINGGRLGFLSGIERNELNLLKSVANGEYQLDERMMIKTDILDENGKITKTIHCLNDAIFSRGDFARLIDIKVSSNGRELLTTRADGVIVSTPTGSTAYSLAAGGPVLSPNLNCFEVTSICPHSLMDRSIVVDSNSTLLVEISSDVMNNAILTCDGEEPVAVSTDTKVAVSVSEYKARLVKVKPDNFYEILKKKIIDRRA
ncbi:MAG: NAD(+)/NADH kinase [Eubacterium sp.]|nr:NAD(+)/NADH kinase [Eubacterium sp.]